MPGKCGCHLNPCTEERRLGRGKQEMSEANGQRREQSRGLAPSRSGLCERDGGKTLGTAWPRWERGLQVCEKVGLSGLRT